MPSGMIDEKVAGGAAAQHLTVRYFAWVREKVGETLTRQRESLLSGDEAGYLSVLDPQAAKADRDRLRVQFRSLQAMKVADWEDELDPPVRKEGDLWRIEVESSPCFVTDGCANASALADTVWRVAGATATLVEWEADDEQPRDGGLDRRRDDRCDAADVVAVDVGLRVAAEGADDRVVTAQDVRQRRRIEHVGLGRGRHPLHPPEGGCDRHLAVRRRGASLVQRH